MSNFSVKEKLSSIYVLCPKETKSNLSFFVVCAPQVPFKQCL